MVQVLMLLVEHRISDTFRWPSLIILSFVIIIIHLETPTSFFYCAMRFKANTNVGECRDECGRRII